MRRLARIGGMILLALLPTALFGQSLFDQSSEATQQFEIADVHVSAKTTNQFIRTGPVRNGRYEVRTATLLDLIRLAWSFDADKILGGPSWLELDRFDVVAKVNPESTANAQKLMLQSLLKDRFKLTLHQDTKPLPTWALMVGKKLQLKEADGSGESGCKLPSASGSPSEGGSRMTFMDANGTGTAVNLGPGMTLPYSCRNMTMAAFAAGLRNMRGAVLATPVLDRTGLNGMWNFDVKWSLPVMGPMANSSDRISLVDALEKQLGLKLEEIAVPTAVLVVDGVDRKPSDNPPGVAEALPVIPAPAEFEVADVKLASAELRRPSRFQMQPGGRFVADGLPMRFFIGRAFNTNNDQIAGLPGWADTVRIDITAKAPAESLSGQLNDPEIIAPMIRALLVERFGLTWHTEQRPVSAYSLVAAKPKLKKAAPDSRTFCKTAPPSPSTPSNSQVLNCQNATMALFTERLRNAALGFHSPIQDATGLAGGWDFTLTFNPLSLLTMNLPIGPGRGGDAAGQGAPVAADPDGGYTIFESIEKQLGLKLEMRKQMLPVIVIDHLEQKPTEN